MKKIIVMSLLSCFLACQSKDAGYQSLDVEEFSHLIESPAVQRLDVRTLAEYSEGHIPGSVNINIGTSQAEFEAMADSVLSKERPVAVYCRGGRRSKEAAAILVRMGFKVYDLDCGVNGWKEAGKELDDE